MFEKFSLFHAVSQQNTLFKVCLFLPEVRNLFSFLYGDYTLLLSSLQGVIVVVNVTVEIRNTPQRLNRENMVNSTPW